MTPNPLLWPGMQAVLAAARRNQVAFLSSILLLSVYCAQFALAGESPSTGPGSGALHYYCSSDSSQSTIFFSSAFDVTGTAPDSAKISDAFKQSIAEEYGYDGDVLCFGKFKTLDAAQAGEKKRVTDLKAANKGKVVETGWTYSRSAATSSAASSPANASPAAGPTAGSAPAQTAPMPAAPAIGTTMAVRILEAVDSSKDPAGKHYKGVVLKPADAGNGVTIPQGSLATVMLMKGQAGWSAHLQSILVKGQPVNVSSGPASVMGSAQSAATSAASTVTSVLGGFGGFGHKSPKPTDVEAIATGDRVVLPPGTQLQFVLSGATPAGAAGSPMTASSGMAGMPNMAGMNHPTVGGHPAGVGAHPANTAASTQSEPTSVGNLTAKIGETLLGPRKQDGMFVVSPDGGHYAVSAMHGSRSLMIVDGVDGPEYDHAAQTYSGSSIDFVFNADGRHSCYTAQRGDDLVAVRDNKEAFLITSVKFEIGGSVLQINQSAIWGPGQRMVGHQCLISPSGAHVAVVSSESHRPPGSQNLGHGEGTSTPAQQAALMAAIAESGFHLFLDGAKSPPYRSIDLNQVAFVAEKLIYAAQTADQKWHMVVNDQPGPAYDTVTSLLVNEDNKHYVFIGSTGGRDVVVADGVSGTLRAHVANGVQNLAIASNGRVAYVAYDGARGPAHDFGNQVLYVGDQAVSKEISPFAFVDHTGQGRGLTGYVIFSPDGKRFAYAKPVPGGIAAVIDGKVGRAYDNIGVIEFSPDSKHAYYIGNRAMNFLVFDGQELDGWNAIKNFVFSHEGGRYAFEAYSAQDGFHLVLDGKASPRYLNVSGFTFSPDSQHYAYSACTNYSTCQLIVDGEGRNVPSLIPFTTRARPAIDFPSLFYSQDSTQLVYGYPKSDGTSGNVLTINGQEVMHNRGLYEYPGFSPDSKHFATMFWTGKAYALFLDGKTGTPYEDFLEVKRNTAKFEDAHTYRFLGVKGGSVYRVVVDLGG